MAKTLRRRFWIDALRRRLNSSPGPSHIHWWKHITAPWHLWEISFKKSPILLEQRSLYNLVSHLSTYIDLWLGLNEVIFPTKTFPALCAHVDVRQTTPCPRIGTPLWGFSGLRLGRLLQSCLACSEHSTIISCHSHLPPASNVRPYILCSEILCN